MSFFRKSIDTVTSIGRTFNTEVTKQVLGTVCPRCNNLSPYGHYSSSDKTAGFLDDSSVSERATYASGAVWLRLEFNLLKNAKLLRKRPCIYCALVIRALQHYSPDWFVDGEVDPEIDPDIDIGLLIIAGRPVEISYSALGSFELSDVKSMVDGGQTEKLSPSLLPHCGPLGVRAPRSDDPTVWKFWNEALERCSAHHPKCQHTRDAVTLPKRVVDVDGQGPMMRLIETKSGQQGKYAALSHCWGGGTPLRTLEKNMKAHKAGISIKSLNPNFHDVVLIARRLGLRYVWIDSLCIIQDSVEDWHEQASHMAAIYQNATVTIALGSSSGPEQPVLCDRDADWDILDLDIQQGATMVTAKVRRKALLSRYGPERDGYSASAEIRLASDQNSPFSFTWPGPLYKRAWCFQEQLLSTRTLHYSPGAVIWECQTERQIEGEAVVEKQEVTSDSTDKAVTWRIIVRDYSSRDITYDTDRLIALAGAAQDMARTTGYHYLAGMWQETLLSDLLWHPHPFGQSRPSTCGAPSWSWASLTGPMTFDGHHGNPGTTTYAEVKHSGTVPRSAQAPFADVQSAYMIIQGPVVQAHLYLNIDDEIFSSSSATQVNGVYADWEKPEKGHYVLTDTRLYESELICENGQVIKTCRRAEEGEPYHRDWDDCIDEPQSYNFEVKVLCLWHTKALDVCGLVLARCDAESETYCRVAQIFKLPREYVKKATMETIKIV